MTKWYKDIYRRHLLDMHINDTDDAFLSKLNADDYYDNLVRAKIQSPMIYLHSHVGLSNYPTESGRTHKRFLRGKNEIKRLIDKCKSGGMKIVGYYSLIFNNYAIEKHSEWEMKYESGESWRDRGQRYGLCCPNNLDYREFVKVQIDELAHEFKTLDGLFFDMPYWEIPCYCDSCKQRFKIEYGTDMPHSYDWDDPHWLDYIKARQVWMVDFVRFVKEYTKEVMPWVTVEFNYAAVIGCDWLGGSTEGINEESEFSGGDIYWKDLYGHSFVCKYYYAVSKNQPFEYMTCRCDASLREHTVTKEEKKLEREIMLTAAHHGASLIIDAIDPIGTADKRVFDRVGEAFSRQIPYEKYMNRGKLYADVAVYFDSNTMFSRDGDDRYNKTAAIGATKKLIMAHVPVTVVANGTMNDLSRYKMIIAPSLRDFDNDEPLKLIDYVREGGTLYLSGVSDSRLMSELLGARVIGSAYPDAPKRRVQLGARTYISPKRQAERIFEDFNEKYPLSLSYHLPLVEYSGDGVLATVTLPYAAPDNNLEFASIHSCPPWESTDYPALIVKKYGKGKVIWCAAELEYDERTAFCRIFTNIVLGEIKRKYEINAGYAIEAVIFEDEDSTLISLCDLKYDPDKFNRDATLSFFSKRIPISITALGCDKSLPFKYTDGIVSCSLPIDDFEMYEIRFN